MFELKRRSQATSYRIYPVPEGVLIGIIALIAICVSAYFIYARALDALEGEIKEGLLRSVAAAATTIDGDAHRKFTALAVARGREKEKNDPEYLKFITPIETIRQASKHVRYIYTNILVNDKVYFIANPSPQNDNDGDGKPDEAPQLMDAYPDAGEALLTALRTHQPAVDKKPYTDKWGTFYSAYAPFYDSKGQFVGTLGMDLELSGFNERLNPVKIATKRAAITGIVLAILWGTTVWFNRRFSVQLNRNRQSILAELEDATRIARGAVGKKSDFLNGLNEQTRIPLNEIQQAAESLLTFSLSDIPRQQASIIEAQSAVLAGLMTDVTEYAAVEAERIRLEQADFDFAVLIEDSRHNIAAKAAEKKIALRVSLHPDVPQTLHGDATRLRQVMDTLLDTAVRSAESGEVVLEAKLTGERIQHVQLEVTIGGAGVSLPGAQEDLRFATAQKLATLMGGEIESNAPVPALSLLVVLKKSQSVPTDDVLLAA